MTASRPDGDPQEPYFFLSYAHVPPYDVTDGSDSNRWVEKLFRELCQHIMHLTEVPSGAAGYMDRELRTGDNWKEKISERLSTCRVFVPLYSPRYFESDQCGREWAAFLERGRGRSDLGLPIPDAIVPAIWTPIRPTRMPAAAQTIQFNHADLGARYVEEGFYGIMKLNRYRTHYQAATMELAKRIVEVARNSPMPRGHIRDYTTVPSAFEDNTAERPITVTVLAPDEDHLPPGRRAYHYGRKPQEWDPFRTSNGARPLADHAMELARARGYLPEVGALDQHAEALSADEPRSPAVMLVDPWATTMDDCRDSLRGIDRPGRRWITVMVPWNREDAQTMANEARLKVCLRETLGNKLTEPDAVSDVPTLDSFRNTLPEVLNRASQHYLKRAPAYPPAGPSTDRPRLIGPEE
ncbi:TIR domain-containing protein [Microtetraspora sp. AC03309]|uniref:TIR-like protein FxsC n=1 Tax=Microtetraspora sp. AC03309 TaxID=2779376 RepID=UPI001E4A9A55|nr:TIR-like protein FxsC [Microtetraspora sp. AC03309]MCC5574325.1 TIR domain-containing protein [Microtetraspora sp. AC03309]